MRSIAVVRQEQKSMRAAGERLQERLATYEQARSARDLSAQNEVCAFLESCEVLFEQKKLLKHGKWSPWLNQYFKRSERIARRWMQVYRWFIKEYGDDWSKRSHATDFNSVAALMRAAGVERREQGKEEAAFVLTLEIASRWLKPLQRLTVESVLALPIDEQRQIKASLKPSHELYQALPDPTPGKESI